MSGAVPRSLRLAVDSDLDQVRLIARAVRAVCADALPPRDVDAVELGLAEAMNNIILHGYGGEAGHRIELSVEIARDEVRLTLSDTAAPMPEGLLDAAGEQRFQFDADDLSGVPEGGMGLSLIRMTMDEVTYHSADGRNWLRMVKKATDAPA